jgi:hypothetical protein
LYSSPNIQPIKSKDEIRRASSMYGTDQVFQLLLGKPKGTDRWEKTLKIDLGEYCGLFVECL